MPVLEISAGYEIIMRHTKLNQLMLQTRVFVWMTCMGYVRTVATALATTPMKNILPGSRVSRCGFHASTLNKKRKGVGMISSSLSNVLSFKKFVDCELYGGIGDEHEGGERAVPERDESLAAANLDEAI